jgi:hypothetical protein
VPLQSGLSCASSKAIIDCSLLFEVNSQTFVGSQYNVAHRPLAGWFVMIATALLTMYAEGGRERERQRQRQRKVV